MSREQKAREAVQRLIPDDRILDVALTYPRGYTRSQGVGMALGGLAGHAVDGFATVGAALGTAAGGRLFANLEHLPPSIVLAISPTAVYTLGRHTSAVFGGWDRLTKLVRFDRSTLRVDLHQYAATLEITLTDTAHDVTLALEAKRVGTMDVHAVLAQLRTPGD